MTAHLPWYFTEPEDGACWLTARREAIDHVLAAIAQSPWSPRLVLRGSALAKAWFGVWAREPGDLDFVVHHQLWRLDEPSVDEMLTDIVADAVAMSRRPGSTVIIDRKLCSRPGLGVLRLGQLHPCSRALPTPTSPRRPQRYGTCSTRCSASSTTASELISLSIRTRHTRPNCPPPSRFLRYSSAISILRAGSTWLTGAQTS
ncbi:nucleotidyl transferase AbiEii/AbiGii toxin family protein [Nocardia sp. NBC_01730]|uniref:nucleotidyl transferase AbiEii/AbiGii toxin family protein n=1 Tax=Nocardia sp. NBC_01730 TaxID=2975998 RepID=UPI002E0D5402|nr:nucleotidyl transferase AbiEii/AbiGii toxin family protein [Nocardia sp. NBC_01730]